MNNKNSFLTIVFLSISSFVFSQDVKGTVLEVVDNKETPVVGANIYWKDNSGGTISDIDGKFKLSNPDRKNSYIVSFIGYQNDTISVGSSDTKIILKAVAELDAVSIRYNTKSSSVSLSMFKEIASFSILKHPETPWNIFKHLQIQALTSPTFKKH